VAIKHLNASNGSKSKMPQGKSLDSCLIRLAVGIVADRNRRMSRESEGDGMIALNLDVVFGLA
jgi:hypothetical protein